MSPDKLAISTTTDGQPPRPGFEGEAAPAPIDPNTGQHRAYWVLSEAERAKGFIRPVRDAYRHVGIRPKHPTRGLTEREKADYGSYGYVLFEQYPEGESPLTGRFWTEAELTSGCGAMTTMGRALAETYARDPAYYGSTFCTHCAKHLRVGKDGEFVWIDELGKDGERVGT